MIHIVFQQADIDALKKAIALDASLRGEVILVADDYAVGPINSIYTADAIETRKRWWRDVLADGDYDGIVDDGSVPDDNETVAILTEKLRQDPEEKLWIWAAQNKHDVSGYYWLVSQLKDFQGRIFILYLNNLPFISEKGNLFYPVNLYNIPPKEFIKAKLLVRPVTSSEFEIDSDEWMKLGNEDRGIRILEGGKKLTQYGYDFYDEELKKFITGDWQRVNKFIHHYLTKAKHVTGDAYLLWRLKKMAREAEIDVQGEIKNMKDFEIKSKVFQPVTGSTAE